MDRHGDVIGADVNGMCTGVPEDAIVLDRGQTSNDSFILSKMFGDRSGRHTHPYGSPRP